jgi:glucokinase
VENGSLVRKEVVTCPSKATYEEVLGRLEDFEERVMKITSF